jgi:outer membrane protein TolC
MRPFDRAVTLVLMTGALWSAAPAAAQPLTADRAVQIALERNSQAIAAEAGVLDARSGLYGAYSALLPRVEASWSRSGSWVTDQVGNQAFGGFVTPPRTTYEAESYSTTPDVSGSWAPLNLSALSALSSARGGVRAAALRRSATRNDVALVVRRQFYVVVQAIQQSRVNSEALRLARDDERRVNALFEVGSVSKSDLLQARVRTAQSELDSLTARQSVSVQRMRLAEAIGVPEAELGDVDTILTVTERAYDEEALLAEAGRARPDLQAAEASLRAARAGLRAAHFARLPYVGVSGSAQFNPSASSRIETPETDDVTGVEIPGTRVVTSTRRETDRQLSAAVAVSWNVFDGLATESRIASARAQVVRAQDARDALRRNLRAEVREALLAYREAIERDRVARRALEAAEENLKLTQQKYNVGSATILELIDAQVQLQRSRSQEVAALAAIRVAEAAIDRVRGRGE